MDDLEAIRLFVADGSPAEDWPYVDQCVRNHYEKLAAAKPADDKPGEDASAGLFDPSNEP